MLKAEKGVAVEGVPLKSTLDSEQQISQRQRPHNARASCMQNAVHYLQHHLRYQQLLEFTLGGRGPVKILTPFYVSFNLMTSRVSEYKI